MAKHLNLVSYFGGKYPFLDWLLPLFPKGNYHFVDLMCGAANVALNVNYPLVTVNDLNDEIINLFEVLRTRQEEFLQALYFTPFSRAELYKCIDEPTPADPLERARRYFIKCQQGYAANGSQNDHKGVGLEYKLQNSNYYRVDNWCKPDDGKKGGKRHCILKQVDVYHWNLVCNFHLLLAFISITIYYYEKSTN